MKVEAAGGMEEVVPRLERFERRDEVDLMLARSLSESAMVKKVQCLLRKLQSCFDR